MDIWEANKLALFVAFVIPGFVSIKTYELLFLSSPKGTASQLIDAVAYSCINYAILFPVIFWVNASEVQASQPILFALFCSMVLFISPIAWVCLLRAVRRSSWLQKWLPHPTEKAWDYVFGSRAPYWIIVTMKDGKRLGGKYGYKSFSTSGSCKEQLYFEETWELNSDGGFERVKECTAGTLIVSADIESIEFFHWT